MNVRKYSLAVIVGGLVSGMALAQAPAPSAQQPVEKSSVEQTTKTTEMKHKDPVTGTASTSTTTEKSAENKSANTHDGKHVAKATTKTESSKSVVTKKADAAKAAEKSPEPMPNSNQTAK
jgi:hypothetical protein